MVTFSLAVGIDVRPSRWVMAAAGTAAQGRYEVSPYLRQNRMSLHSTVAGPLPLDVR
ncbi:hypothetical protein GCM10022226_39680 [Sphaerisporangium flaviroseum]|uniref:IS110 family transposase n=1 Tax=Sphaerisporangium flaviroseum TaxID=509199 RepID=A0ABP7IC70_9ACTN